MLEYDDSTPIQETKHARLKWQVYEGNLIWNMEQFILFGWPGNLIQSPEFEAGDTKWRVEFRYVYEEDCFRVFVWALQHRQNTVQCECEVTMLVNDEQLEKRSVRHEFIGTSPSGWQNFVSTKHLSINDNDTLTLKCKLKVFERTSVVSSSVIGHQLRGASGTTTVTKHYEQILEQGLFSDVSLVCNGEMIPAHRNILSMRSLVFRKMFESGMVESQKGVVTIDHCELATFKEFLRFLYTGNIDLHSLSADLLALSDQYDVEDLRTLCQKTLMDQLTPENALSLLVIADTHHSAKLKAAVTEFAILNYETVMASEEFPELCKSHPQLMIEFHLAFAAFAASRQQLRSKRQKKT